MRRRQLGDGRHPAGDRSQGTRGGGVAGITALRCCGCGGYFPEHDGSTHPYLLSSPGCWTAYGELLAREYQDPALFAACHRLTVDAYAVQHPGVPTDRRAVQSVWLHFASLHAIHEQGCSFDDARMLMQRLAGRAYPPLPSSPVHTFTLADVLAGGLDDHVPAVMRWARQAYADWAPLLRPMFDSFPQG